MIRKLFVGGVLSGIALIACGKPSDGEIKDAVRAQFCSTMDLNKIGNDLVAKMRESHCIAGFQTTTTAALCNAPSGFAKWTCAECATDERVVKCGSHASVSIDQRVEISTSGFSGSALIKGFYSAQLNFDVSNAKVGLRNPEPDADQPGFDYFSSVAQGSIEQKASVSAEIEAKDKTGTFTVKVTTELNCEIGATAGFAKTASIGASTCGVGSPCPPGMHTETAEAEGGNFAGDGDVAKVARCVKDAEPGDPGEPCPPGQHSVPGPNGLVAVCVDAEL